MRTDSLEYPLAPDRIAQHPREPRDHARLLVDRGPAAAPAHHEVRDLPGLLEPGDLVVVNDTRVLPARVAVCRDSGGSGEVLLLEDRGDGWWEALCRPSRKLVEGRVVTSTGGAIAFEMGVELGDGRRLVRPHAPAGPGGDRGGQGAGQHGGGERGGDAWLLGALATDGEMPLPPYITAHLDDPERYQTTFARRPASAAAPTAGLHLTDAVFATLAQRGVGVARVELVVGLDTFRPVTTELVEDHPIHTEHYDVPAATWAAVQEARAAGGRVVAVGTTSVRALESAAHRGTPAGRTDLFITPGFDFAVVDLMMTNFHLPRSSLLALVEAFVGPRWRDLYATAAAEGYRFLSFGDAMLLERAPVGARGAAPAGSTS